MAEPVYIAWNPTNWITIVLMAALGFMLLGLAATAWKSRSGASS